MSTKRFLLTIAIMLLALPLWAAQNATNTKGFAADGVYNYNGVDNVNLFNGGLTVQIPLGGKYTAGDRLTYSFTLTYNSALWDYEERSESVPPSGQVVIHSEGIPNNRTSNAGLGWLVTLGELVYHENSLTYIAPDGAETTFTGKTPQTALSPLILSPEPVLYSLDGHYLRMRKGTAGTRYVDFPDGVTKEFMCVSSDGCEPLNKNTTKFALKKISDSFGNQVTIERGSEPAHHYGNLWTWSIKESTEAGRTIEHQLVFQYADDPPHDAPFGWIVKELDLEVSPSTFTVGQPITTVRRVAYVFNYDRVSLARTPLHTAVAGGVHIQPLETMMRVPVLTSVTLPDAQASKWSFTYKAGDTSQIYTQNKYPQSYDDKLLESLTYPTGGSVRYEWQQYRFPRRACFTENHPPGCIEPCSGDDHDQLPSWTDKAGVRLRQYTSSGTGSLTPTRYILTYADPVQQSGNQVCFGEHTLRNTVVDPLGNVTLNYFSLVADPTPVFGGDPLNFGLPVAVTIADPIGDGRNLSSEVFQCPSPDLFDPNVLGNNDETIRNRAKNPQSAGCTPKRQTYVRYEVTPAADCDDVTYDTPGCYGANRRLLSERVVFNDDGNAWTRSDNSNFDGLGHYRQIDAKSNFGELNATGGSAGNGTGGLNGPRGDWQVTTTNWNPATRFGGLAYPDVGARWIINTYDSQTVELKTTGGSGEPAAQGGVVKSEYFFDELGFLKQKRTLAGGARASTDFLTDYKRVDLGDGRVRIEERYYGGDCYTIGSTTHCPNLDTGALPVGNPGSADYVIFRTSRFGSTERVEYRECSGDKVILRTELNEIDPATGLTMSSRDTADAVTTYLYDELNRVAEIDPPGEAATTYAYTKASGTAPAKVVATTADGTSTKPQSKWEFDPWGRVSGALHLTPAGWNRATTRYYPNGWVSEQTTTGPDTGTNAGVTKFTKYDPFGRVLSKTLADSVTQGGADSHYVTYEYQGNRVVKETVNGVALGSGDNGSTKTTRLTDALGHLVAAYENSDGWQQTSYEYDSSGRMVKVKMGAQVRTFTYDNRGLLLNETHPELSGNSAGITYKAYDARGHAHEIHHQTPPTRTALDLSFTYDGAERLTLVKRPQTPNEGARILKSWTYFGPADTGKTGLLKTTERHNWIRPPASPAAAPVDYTVSQNYNYWDSTHRLKSVVLRVSGLVRWKTVYSYDNLGNLSSLQYPKLTTGCNPLVDASCLELGPDRLVSNSYQYGYLTSVPGFVDSITYNINELPQTVKHANGVTWTQAVSSRYLPRPEKLTLSNGSTQLWTSDSYKYDANGNIFAIGNYAFVYDDVGRLSSASIGGDYQQFSYDRYGNHKSWGVPVDLATNRITGAGYDGAGNLTSFTDPRETAYAYTYEYDSFNMMTHLRGLAGDQLALGRLFLYDINDERVATIDYHGASIRETWSARGAGNQVIRDFQRVYVPTTGGLPSDPAGRGWTFVQDYVFRGSSLAATIAGGATTHVDVDHLGTPRLTTTSSGAFALRTYRAFGDEINATPDPRRLKFTGHEHDEAGTYNQSEIKYGDLEYMHARYYDAKLARFLSIDPGRDVDAMHPQSWNLYAYVRNSPIGTADPTGRAADGQKQPEYWQADSDYFGEILTQLYRQAQAEEKKRQAAARARLAEARSCTGSGRCGLNESGKVEVRPDIKMYDTLTGQLVNITDLEDRTANLANYTMGVAENYGWGDNTPAGVAEWMMRGDANYHRSLALVNRNGKGAYWLGEGTAIVLNYLAVQEMLGGVARLVGRILPGPPAPGAPPPVTPRAPIPTGKADPTIFH